MNKTRPLLLCMVVLLAGCGSNGVGPQHGSLRLEAATERSTIGLGDTSRIIFRLRNLGSDSVFLGFPNSCQVLPYITSQRPGQIIYPSGGAWGCRAVVTSLALAPGAERQTSILVRGGSDAGSPAIPLLPGVYRAYAQLEHPDYPIRSVPITIRVN